VAISSGVRSRQTPTIDSRPTPAARRRRAIRLAREFSSPYVVVAPRNQIAGASGAAATCRSKSSGMATKGWSRRAASFHAAIRSSSSSSRSAIREIGWSGAAAACSRRRTRCSPKRCTVARSKRSVAYSITPISPVGDSMVASIRSNLATPVSTSEIVFSA
jgi:hypothetical protein